MHENETLQTLRDCGALLEGHFLLSSGRHSGGYCQCAQLLRFPHLAQRVLKTVADQVRGLGMNKICGPAMGGVIVSYELARQLSLESLFTERQDGEMRLRRGFTVGAGDNVLIAEDVVTTGVSTMETARALEALGARVIGVACIADRRSASCVLPFPVYAAVRLDIPSWPADECPLCEAGGPPPVKPGSRA